MKMKINANSDEDGGDIATKTQIYESFSPSTRHILSLWFSILYGTVCFLSKAMCGGEVAEPGRICIQAYVSASLWEPVLYKAWWLRSPKPLRHNSSLVDLFPNRHKTYWKGATSKGNIASDLRHRNAMKNHVLKKHTLENLVQKKVARSNAFLDKSNMKRYWKRAQAAPLRCQNHRDEPCKQLFIERKFISRGIESIQSKAELKKRLAEQITRQKMQKLKKKQFAKPATSGKGSVPKNVKECYTNNDAKETWEIHKTGDEIIMVGTKYILGEEFATLQEWVNGMGEISRTRENEDLTRNNQGLKANPATSTKVHWTQVV